MSQEINGNDDFQRVDDFNSMINTSITSKSVQTNAQQWLPIRYPQIPVQMRPPFCHPFNSGIGPMYRLPYNCNLNAMLSIPPFMPNPSNFAQPILPPILPPISSMVSIESNETEDSSQKHFICRLCSSFSSNDVNELKDHLNAHSSPNRPFVCQICRKGFKFRCLWRNHIVIHMSVKRKLPLISEEHNRIETDTNDCNQCEDNRYKCEECGFSCKSKSDWEQHSRLDCKTRPLKCPECEYETYSRTKLLRHRATHIRDRPYACVECNSTFSQSGSLKGHLIKVHKISGFLINCSYCQSFETKNFGLLKTHIERVHENTPFGYTLVKF